MAAEELAELGRIDTKLKAMKAELTAAVLARGSHLMDINGIGPASAARILADVGDVARFPDRNHFASWTGTAPIDASSGEQIRHRLSRAGNRRMNHVLYIAGIVQLRNDTDGLLPAQASTVQNPDGSDALPAPTAVRRGLPATRYRRRQEDR
jgi:transposase